MEEKIYVRNKLSVMKTDEDGFVIIKDSFPSARKISKKTYLIFKLIKHISILLILFPIWIVFFLIDVPINKYIKWYERIVEDEYELE